jgi:DNA mismatch repair protein PMS2
MIQAIDKTTIHQICSGQVVIDLATAVKELVENSLDSGATVVEVKLRNMGIDIIEVCDNGSGIDPLNYEGIAMKHHTSKLKDFEDVYSVSTFGFRGEALNSLCELSGAFSVATKQANNAVGSHLQFDQIGRYNSVFVSYQAKLKFNF